MTLSQISRRRFLGNAAKTAAALSLLPSRVFAALPDDQEQVYWMAGLARVRAVRGSALCSQTGEEGPWQELVVNRVLREGSIIKTLSKSEVDLLLYSASTGPVVRLKAKTVLCLERLWLGEGKAKTISETILILKKGRILGNVNRLAAGSKYEVRTSLTQVRIKGTEYDISADGVVRCISGALLVIYSPPSGQPQRIELKAGETFTPPTGRKY
jgi:hypothetical protein